MSLIRSLDYQQTEFIKCLIRNPTEIFILKAARYHRWIRVVGREIYRFFSLLALIEGESLRVKNFFDYENELKGRDF